MRKTNNSIETVSNAKSKENNTIITEMSSVQSMQMQQVFKGPLPDPESLKKYYEIDPKIVEVITKMATDEQKRIIDYDIYNYRYAMTGLWFAFGVAIIGIGGSIYLFAIDKTGAGFVTFLTTTVTIISSFIYGNKKKKENNDKPKD